MSQKTIKFDQIAMPVSQVFKVGEIVIGSEMDFETGAGKVVSINDDTQEVVFEAASPEEAQARKDQVFAHLKD